MTSQSQKFVVDFGTRKLYDKQYSVVVTLPKQAIKNCSDGMFYKVSVQLVCEKDEKYLKLCPIFDLQKVIA